MTAADKARAAHNALVLEEQGITDPRAVERLAGKAPERPAEGEDQVVGGLGGANVPVIASRLLERVDDRTLERYVRKMRLPDLFEEWHKQVDLNLQENHPEDFAAVQEANEKARVDAIQADKIMAGTGEWPRDAIVGRSHGMPYGHAANDFYDLGAEGFADGGIQWPTPTIKIVLVDSADYAVNLASHQFLSSVAGAGRVATTAALTAKTKAAGVLDCDNPEWALVTGDPCEAFIVVQSSAVGGGADVADTAQRLILYFDTATGIPITPNGGNIGLVIDSGANRLAKL